MNSLPRLQAPEEKSARTHTGGLIVLRCWRDVLEKEVEIWFLQQEETDRYKARHVPDLLAWHATIEGLENASSPWATRNAPPLQSAHPCHRYETSSTSVILVSTTVLSSLERERERERESTTRPYQYSGARYTNALEGGSWRRTPAEECKLELSPFPRGLNSSSVAIAFDSLQLKHLRNRKTRRTNPLDNTEDSVPSNPPTKP